MSFIYIYMINKSFFKNNLSHPSTNSSNPTSRSSAFHRGPSSRAHIASMMQSFVGFVGQLRVGNSPFYEIGTSFSYIASLLLHSPHMDLVYQFECHICNNNNATFVLGSMHVHFCYINAFLFVLIFVSKWRLCLITCKCLWGTGFQRNMKYSIWLAGKWKDCTLLLYCFHGQTNGFYLYDKLLILRTIYTVLSFRRPNIVEKKRNVQTKRKILQTC